MAWPGGATPRRAGCCFGRVLNAGLEGSPPDGSRPAKLACPLSARVKRRPPRCTGFVCAALVFAYELGSRRRRSGRESGGRAWCAGYARSDVGGASRWAGAKPMAGLAPPSRQQPDWDFAAACVQCWSAGGARSERGVEPAAGPVQRWLWCRSAAGSGRGGLTGGTAPGSLVSPPGGLPGSRTHPVIRVTLCHVTDGVGFQHGVVAELFSPGPRGAGIAQVEAMA